MNQQIEPKPSVYRGITYSSRLEARWAVLIDNCKNVVSFQYQPKTFVLPNGWEYTPDFLVRYQETPNHHQQMFLEIKPSTPTKEYRDTLSTFAKVIPHPLFLLCGSIYKDNYISSWLLQGHRVSLTHPADVFKGYDVAYKTAANYRFDIQ
jgi:hypothetical protein